MSVFVDWITLLNRKAFIVLWSRSGKLKYALLSISQRWKTGKQTSHCWQSQEAFCLWRSNETRMCSRLLRHNSDILFTMVQHKLLPACVSDYYVVWKMAVSASLVWPQFRAILVSISAGFLPCNSTMCHQNSVLTSWRWPFLGSKLSSWC